MPYGLTDIELQKLKDVFTSNTRIEQAILYGSRAKGTHKPFSDVDITLVGNELTRSDLNRLLSDIDDLLFPYNFDLSLFHTLKNDDLIEHIHRRGIVIFRKEVKWKEYKLGEIAEIQTGPFGSQLHMSDYKTSGTPIITVEHLGDNKITHKNLPLVSDEDRQRLIKYTLQEGDIVFSRVGSVDRRAYVGKTENGWMFSGRCLRVRPNGTIVDSKYLSYYFGQESFKENIRRIAVGATMPSINTTILSGVSISLPPLTVQKHITSILSSLDDKIDLLNRENTTLEAMVETLFHKWFENKEEVPVGDVIETTSGGTPSRKHENYYENGTIYWVKSKELNSSFLLDTEEKITLEAVKNSSAKFIPANSVLIAMYGATVGEYAIIAKEMTCNQAVCALLPNDNYPYTYLYLWAKSMKNEFINLACGAAQQNISQVLIKEQYVSADVKAIKQFHVAVKPFFEKMKLCMHEIQSLTKLRDGLMIKLMFNPINI